MQLRRSLLYTPDGVAHFGGSIPQAPSHLPNLGSEATGPRELAGAGNGLVLRLASEEWLLKFPKCLLFKNEYSKIND